MSLAEGEAAAWLVQLRAQLEAMPGAHVALSDQQLQSLSPIALAYIGDGVYELFMRSCLLLPPRRIQDFHHHVVKQVRAEQQAECLTLLQPLLTADENDILRKGRNAASRGPRRVDPRTYQLATAFEALIGYLYLTNPVRLTELLSHLVPTISEEGKRD